MTTPLPRLHRLITAAFDESELRTLAFDLGVPSPAPHRGALRRGAGDDALPGQGTAAAPAPLRLCGTGVSRELILYLGRRRRFADLLAALDWMPLQ